MNAQEIQHQIDQYIVNHSGLDQHRDYLGISKIADCPRKAYREYFDGVSLSEEAHRMCFTGYEQETNILVMLVGMGVAKLLREDEKEVVAPFDNRLRGHIDALTCEGDLLEIKSVSLNKFQGILASGKAPRRNYIQVQLYMLYGRWAKTFIVYRCRETYEHTVLYVPFNGMQALKFQQKAARLLESIDSKVEPECECRRCG